MLGLLASGGYRCVLLLWGLWYSRNTHRIKCFWLELLNSVYCITLFTVSTKDAENFSFFRTHFRLSTTSNSNSSSCFWVLNQASLYPLNGNWKSFVLHIILLLDMNVNRKGDISKILRNVYLRLMWLTFLKHMEKSG